jgi:hypothetical protein
VTLRVVLVVGALALAILSSCVDSAPAATWRSALTSQQVADAVTPTARRAWPGSRCAGRERVRVDNPGLAARSALVGGRRLLGYAIGAPFLPHRRSANCLVIIRAGMTPLRTCSVLAHEFGHLAGRRHTRTGIMAPTVTVYPPCRYLARALGRAAFRATVLHLSHLGSRPRCRTTPRGTRCELRAQRRPSAEA